MPVGSMPYLTRSGRFSRTERSSFLRNSASGTICSTPRFRIESCSRRPALGDQTPHQKSRKSRILWARIRQAARDTRNRADSRVQAGDRQGGRSQRSPSTIEFWKSRAAVQRTRLNHGRVRTVRDPHGSAGITDTGDLVGNGRRVGLGDSQTDRGAGDHSCSTDGEPLQKPPGAGGRGSSLSWSSCSCKATRRRRCAPTTKRPPAPAKTTAPNRIEMQNHLTLAPDLPHQAKINSRRPPRMNTPRRSPR